MLESCHKHKDCHGDLNLEKAMGCIQMEIMSRINNCNNEDHSEICFLHRLAKSYDMVSDTLIENGLITTKQENQYEN